MDEKIDAGEFIVFRDGDYIRVARGINSLTTVSVSYTHLCRMAWNWIQK